MYDVLLKKWKKIDIFSFKMSKNMTWSLSIGVFRNYDNLIRHAGGLMMTEIKISGWTQEIWEGSRSKGTRVIQRLSDFVRITTECRGLCSVRCVSRCWRCQRLFFGWFSRQRQRRLVSERNHSDWQFRWADQRRKEKRKKKGNCPKW